LVVKLYMRASVHKFVLELSQRKEQPFICAKVEQLICHICIVTCSINYT
jgi:hypothetical protein